MLFCGLGAGSGWKALSVIVTRDVSGAAAGVSAPTLSASSEALTATVASIAMMSVRSRVFISKAF